jgi:polyhydroxybutyrate depolymerase
LVLATALMVATVAAAGERDYRSHVPAKVHKPAPLVVVLHCLGCAPNLLDENLGIERLADARGFMVATPVGTVDSHGELFWNATDACCDFDHSNVDDVAYVTRVIDEMVRRGADPNRVYLLGLSNGGFLAHRLACDLASRIAAFASIGGADWKDPARCKARHPVAALEIHGDHDDIVRYDGGPLGGTLPKREPYPSARDSIAGWARRNGCAPTATTATHIHLDRKLAGAETVVERWEGCAAAAAELWTIRGGGHVPAFTPDFFPRIYDFFTAHPKR